MVSGPVIIVDDVTGAPVVSCTNIHSLSRESNKNEPDFIGLDPLSITEIPPNLTAGLAVLSLIMLVAISNCDDVT